jgi:hypothetical protein
MKFLPKRKKNFLYLVLILVLFFYFLINYFDPTLLNESNYKYNKKIIRKNGNYNKINPKNEIKNKIQNYSENDSIKNKINHDRLNELNTSKESINTNITKNLRMRYYAIDGNGLSSVNTIITKCVDGIEIEVTNDIKKADFSYFLNSVPSIRNKELNHFYMVYAMESEPHSGGGESWMNADFRMWYNLDLSYPEPATYFDMKTFLPDLLSKPSVEFENKETSAPLVWVLSNCAAFNGRESYIRKLMKLINVDSYGGCLKNKNTHTGVRMMGNIELYSKYKFVIAIENSNCQDYVTEKLVHAIASGSIPIVAGNDGKPDYLRYMPKNSYINIYDYKSIEELANHIKNIMSNKELYEKYIYFRKNHNYTKQYMLNLKLHQLIDLVQTVIDPIENSKFFQGIVSKEKSEDKLCKIARHIKNTPKDILSKQIEEKRMNRPSTNEACLSPGNLAKDFN